MELPPHGPDEVRRIAALARLHLREEEVEPLARDFGRILGYVARLRERDEADAVEPLVHVTVLERPAATLRDDAPVDGGPAAPLPRDVVLALAPDREGDHLRVPRVLEEGR